MKKLLVLTAIIVGGAMVIRRLLPGEEGEGTSSLRDTMRGRMMERMCKMMEEMPEDSPPGLILSTLPRLQEQSDQMLILLREQNELLKERLPAAQS